MGATILKQTSYPRSCTLTLDQMEDMENGAVEKVQVVDLDNEFIRFLTIDDLVYLGDRNKVVLMQKENAKFYVVRW